MGYTHFSRLSTEDGYSLGASGSESEIISSAGAITATGAISVNGTEVINSSGRVVYAGGSAGSVVVNGTASTVDLDDATVFSCTANAALTITPSGGYVGQISTILFANTVGTATNVVTLGTGFKKTGTLSIVSANEYAITFVYDGTSYYEISRTAALT